MVKFAKGEEKPWNPIEKNTINSLAAPPQPASPPAPPEPEPAPVAAAPAAEAEPPKATPERPKRSRAKRPADRKPSPVPGRGERLTRAVKCLFTPSEEQELRSLVDRLRNEAGTPLTLSHLMRPYFDLLLHCEEQLSQELGRAKIARPLNDKTALALFERQLAEVIHSALRKAPLLRSDHHETEA